MVSQPAYLKDLKAYARSKPHDTMEPEDAVADLMAESDRGAIILAATSLDDALEIALLKKMPALESDRETRKRLFEVNGPLASFSSRINVAYGLGILDRQFRDIVDLIREIRNCCAHSRRPISLDVPELRSIVKVALSILEPDKFVDQSATTYRHAFVVTCQFIREGILTGHFIQGEQEVTERLVRAAMGHVATRKAST